MEAKNLAIMLTDIKGFTSKTASFSRTQTQELLARHRELVLPVIEKFKGRLVKTIGDAFLVVFNSPTDAVICGIEVQEALKAYNSDKQASEKIEIRIAINSGEVSVHDDGDIYGDPVNITSRLESIAEAGEVFFTEAVYLAMNKREVPSSEIGYRQFKGIPEKIKVFRVLREVPVGEQPPGPLHEAPGEITEVSGTPSLTAKTAGFWRRFSSLLTDVAILLIILNALGLHSCGPRYKSSIKDNIGGREITVKNVDISENGITIASNDGNQVKIDKNGVQLAGSPKKWTRTQEKEGGFDTGFGEKKHIPFKVILWVLYTGILLWRFGATPGMKILKLKAVDMNTGGPLPADKAFLRAFFSLVSLFLLLGYIWASWEKDKRTWHDIIAGSRIVKA